jgi:hypothetical protein
MRRASSWQRSARTLRLDETDRKLLRSLVEPPEAEEATEKSAKDAKCLDVDCLPWGSLTRWGQIMRGVKILTCIGVIAAVVSLVLSLEANRTSRDALHASAIAQTTGAVLQFDSMFLANDKDGRMLKRFITDKELTGTAADARFSQFATAQFDLLEGYRALVELPGLSESFDRDAFYRWFNWTFQQNSDLCRKLDALKTTYGAEFIAEAKRPAACGALID